MTGQVTVVDREVVDSPVRRRSRSRLVLVLALAIVMALGAVIGAVVGGRNAHGPGGERLAAPGDRHGLAAAPVNPLSPAAAVTSLLDRRAIAIRDHDRAAFAATLDPEHPAFRRAQLAMFAHLGRVKFASWSYQLGGGVPTVPARDEAGTFAPGSVALRYRLAGFDRGPVEHQQFPSFVERAGRWYVASWSDVRGAVSGNDLWDYAPVAVVRAPGVLVLGAPRQRGTMTEIATVMSAAIARVTALWGSDWSRRVVVQVPRSEREMGRLNNDRGDLGQIAALTSAEISPLAGRPSPAGDRVTINPKIWPKLGPLGRSVVLTHELTHVATQSVSGVQTPRWLEEGFADYVGFGVPGVTVEAAAAELASEVRSGQLPRRLPADRAFRFGGSRLAQAYEEGWLACRYIAQRYGRAALVHVYRAVGTSRLGATAAVDISLKTVLRLTTAEFTVRWRTYVRRELAG